VRLVVTKTVTLCAPIILPNEIDLVHATEVRVEQDVRAGVQGEGHDALPRGELVYCAHG
jgi:hypothetical protein